MNLPSIISKSSYPASIVFLGTLTATASSTATDIATKQAILYLGNLFMTIMRQPSFPSNQIKWILPYTIVASVTGFATLYLMNHFEEEWNKQAVELDLSCKVKIHLNETISILVGTLSASIFLRCLLGDTSTHGNEIKVVVLHSPIGFGMAYAFYRCLIFKLELMQKSRIIPALTLPLPLPLPLTN